MHVGMHEAKTTLSKLIMRAIDPDSGTIRFNDRVLALGSTGSGKSELLNVLFSRMRGGAQRLLVDTKREFAIEGVNLVLELLDQPVFHRYGHGCCRGAVGTAHGTTVLCFNSRPQSRD